MRAPFWPIHEAKSSWFYDLLYELMNASFGHFFMLLAKNSPKAARASARAQKKRRQA
ncbi:MAG: hypothetical protein IJT59_01060 [Desulfovibrionaceae bacterium]|nr:hypothetical protein [Desulfovibrionaceae bacterium]